MQAQTSTPYCDTASKHKSVKKTPKLCMWPEPLDTRIYKHGTYSHEQTPCSAVLPNLRTLQHEEGAVDVAPERTRRGPLIR